MARRIVTYHNRTPSDKERYYSREKGIVEIDTEGHNLVRETLKLSIGELAQKLGCETEELKRKSLSLGIAFNQGVYPALSLAGQNISVQREIRLMRKEHILLGLVNHVYLEEKTNPNGYRSMIFDRALVKS
ncbi:MAG: hypothetical protein COT14_02850 [Candidatus Diapherotrites archaeon CG08_land_8_20_14_0_20_30_16]|nr:MAG: hypothetical protein COT14_02850 [Candidatus Diapherotrites archaeon CG08_land_8_20_14_0_20_30_16]